MYPIKDEREKQQIEVVFGLTGGELNDAPLRYAYGKRSADVAPPQFRRGWARYFYDGVPDYDSRQRKHGGDYITIVACEVFGQMPRKIQARGRTWIKVARYGHSGEAECSEFGSSVRESQTDDHGRCILCDEEDVHGHVYLGDGYAEIVYKAKGS